MLLFLENKIFKGRERLWKGTSFMLTTEKHIFSVRELQTGYFLIADIYISKINSLPLVHKSAKPPFFLTLLS